MMKKLFTMAFALALLVCMSATAHALSISTPEILYYYCSQCNARVNHSFEGIVPMDNFYHVPAYKCMDCGHVVKRYNSNSRNDVHYSDVAACLQTAYCDLCGGVYGGHGHFYVGDAGKYYQSADDSQSHSRDCTEPNCDHVDTAKHTKNGCGEQVCTVCRLTYVADHEWDVLNPVSSSEATCYAPGTLTVKCLHCQETGVVENPDAPQKDAHEFANYVTVVAADCLNNATETSKCTWHDGVNCTAEDTREIPDSALGHALVKDERVEATCTATGLTEGEHCSACGEVLVAQAVIPATGHTGVKDERVEATCTGTGLTEGEHCSVCGEVLVAQAVIPASGHTGVIDAQVAATCTQTGLTEGEHCSVCGEVLVAQAVIPASGHTEVIDERVEATCLEAGLTEGRHCAVCQAVLVAQEIIPTNGRHSYAATAVAPSCTDNGYTNYICTVCGEAYTDGFTEAYGHWFGLWEPNLDGTHSAACRRSGCGYVGTADCTLYEVTVMDGEAEIIMTVCPVCGEHEEVVFEEIPEAAVDEIDRYALPRGELIVRGMDAPFEGALYAFTATYEFAGNAEPFNGVVSVTLPLDEELYAEFRLARVDVVPATDSAERTEVWTDVAFTYEDGELTFETDAAGLFLLLPVE